MCTDSVCIWTCGLTPLFFLCLCLCCSCVLEGFVGDGLFTSDDDEEIWGTAHRILLPAFSNNGMCV